VLALEVREVRLLVEGGALQTERVDDVVDLDGLILKTLLGLLGGGVGTSVLKVLARVIVRWVVVGRRTDLDGTLDNHLAVHLVGDAIDLLHIIRVRDDLVVGEDVLGGGQKPVS
jgi:hypothetical protein